MLEVYHRSFELAEGQGAALMTKYQTHREDIQRSGTSEDYVKRHYNSWVAFARETGHGNNINPVLVTGVDMTRDFAMMAYSNGEGLKCEFKTSDLGGDTASVWGTWCTPGHIHTNCGPHPHSSPSPQTVGALPTGVGNAGTISDEYDQCVFIRYYTVRKMLGIPRVIKAGAGPHHLDPGDREAEGSQMEVQSSGPDSDIMSSPCDDGRDNDKSSFTSTESEPDVVIHNTTAVGPPPSFSTNFYPL